MPFKPRVPHLRDGLIVAKVGLERSATGLLSPPDWPSTRPLLRWKQTRWRWSSAKTACSGVNFSPVQR